VEPRLPQTSRFNMATLLEVPTLTDGTEHYEQRTALDGEEYLFEFDWAARREGWVFNLYKDNEEREAVVEGQLVICNWNLLRRAQNGPPGLLYCILNNDSKGMERPGLRELGDRVLMVYALAEET